MGLFPSINTWIDWLLFGYNIVAGNGSPLPKESALNFLSPIVATDNPTLGTTDISLPSGTTLPAPGPAGDLLTSNGTTWASQTPASQTFALEPIDLRFQEVASGQLPGFQPASMITLDEEFTDSTLTRFNIITSSGSSAVTPVISGGTMTLTNTSGQNTIVQEGPALTVPQIAYSIVVNEWNNTGSTSFVNIGLGIGNTANNAVNVVWQSVSGSISIQTVVSGTSTLSDVTSVSWTAPFELGISIVTNSVIAWYRPNSNSQWTKVAAYDIQSLLDLRGVNLSDWYAQFQYDSDSAHTYSVGVKSFQQGSFGGFAIRDICCVTNEAGDVVLDGSVCTFTATMTDPTSSSNYCGVFAYDLVGKTLTQTGVLYVNRSSKLYNDGACHLVQDGTGGYYVWITTWGNYGSPQDDINIIYKHETVLNLVSGVNAPGSFTQPSLPGLPSGAGSYDPFAVKVSGTWYLAYVVDPSAGGVEYPALATTTDLSTYTAVAQDTAAVPFEGSRITPIGGTYTALFTALTPSGVNEGVPYLRAYDLTLTWIGNIYVYGFTDIAGGLFPAHGMFVPYGNYVYWLGFDNSEYNSVSGVSGAFRVFRSPAYAAAA